MYPSESFRAQMPYTSSLPRLLKCYTVRNWEFILFRVISWWMLMWLLLALFCLQPFTMTHKWLSFLSTTTNTPLGYVGKSVFSWRWCAASVVEVRRPRRRGRLNETTTILCALILEIHLGPGYLWICKSQDNNTRGAVLPADSLLSASQTVSQSVSESVSQGVS